MAGYFRLKNLFGICVLLMSVSVLCSEAIRTILVENLCGPETSSVVIRFNVLSTGVLKSVRRAEGDQNIDCKIKFMPQAGASVVLSFYNYDFMPGDELTIEDADHHTIAIRGTGHFEDESKSYTYNRAVVLHYISSNTSYHSFRGGFQLTYTQVRDFPCRGNEMKCKNFKCIEKYMACDGHNHCGDNSDKDMCTPEIKPYRAMGGSNVGWLIGIVIGSIAIFVVVVVFTVYLVRRRKIEAAKQSSEPKVETGTAPLPVVSTISSKDLSQPATSHHVHALPNSDIQMSAPTPDQSTSLDLGDVSTTQYHVPPLYPNLDPGMPQPPTAPGYEEGHANPNFHKDE